MPPLAKVRIYTDGSCQFCCWARGLVEPHDCNHLLDFRDFQRPEIVAETPFSTAELSGRIHVQDLDGSWYVGFWGWIVILDGVPRYRWLARLLSCVPFRWIGPTLYDFLARNRYRIPRFLLRLLGAPTPCRDACYSPVRLNP